MDRHGTDAAPPDGGGFARATRVPLTDWTLEVLPSQRGLPEGVPEPLASGGTLPATVPGCVHTDLLPHGFVSDVAVDGSEADDAWVMRAGWRYRTTIDLPRFAGVARRRGEAEPDDEAADDAARPRAVLEFGGIDTIATVSVNGEQRLTTSDMHRRFELDISADLADGPVEVVVDLLPAIDTAEAAEAVNPLPRPGAYVIPYNQVRKMACSYGWDWGPTTGTAGLWRPVVVHVWSGARLADVAVTAKAGATPTVEVAASVDGANSTVTDTVVGVEVTGPGGIRVSAVAEVSDEPEGDADLVTGQASVRVPVPGARTWHPVGDGDQPLYTVTVTLKDAAGRVLEEQTRRVGFREVELIQADDAHGRSFELHVNGQRLWVRGLNWIPDDPFPSRLTRDRLHRRIQQAVDTGTNLLRVWGGGIFESDDFYDICDELGVLVWQDFLFACAAYPEDDATVAEVQAEASDNIDRLRHRASLVVWSGCNENLWGFEEWGWQQELNGRPWGALYYGETLPEVLAQLDDARPYVPGSPFSPGGLPERTDGPIVDDYSRGLVHIWDVWNLLDYTFYETKFPRFAAEFGYQAPASWPTLAAAIGSADLGPGAFTGADPRLEIHQKADQGTDKLTAGLVRHFPQVPTDGPGWYYATQLLQARAVLTGIGHLRSLHETCSGTIWWQHNDMWPAISWSIVDVRGRRKLAWYAMREVYRPRDVFLGGAAGGPEGPLLVTAVNDTREAWTARLTIAAFAADGSGRGSGEVTLEVPALGAARAVVAEVIALPADAALVVVSPEGGGRVVRWLVHDLDLVLGEADLEVLAVAAGVDEVSVEVRSAGLVRDLCLLAELVVPDAVVSQQLVTLLPGESATFTVTGPKAAAVPAEQWSSLLWHDARLR